MDDKVKRVWPDRQHPGRPRLVTYPGGNTKIYWSCPTCFRSRGLDVRDRIVKHRCTCGTWVRIHPDGTLEELEPIEVQLDQALRQQEEPAG